MEAALLEEVEEGKLPIENLEILDNRKKVNDFLKEPGVLIFDSSADNLMTSSEYFRFIRRGGVAFSTRKAAEEAANLENNHIMRAFNHIEKEGNILEIDPEVCSNELRIFGELSKNLSKSEIRRYIMENRHMIYKTLHEAMRGALDKYYLEIEGRKKKRDTWRAADVLSIISVFYHWDRRLKGTDAKMLRCMERSDSRCLKLARRLTDDIRDASLEVPGHLYKVMVDMNMDERDAEKFVRREGQFWCTLFQTGMRHMLKNYLRLLAKDVRHDLFKGTHDDYSNGFWKEKGLDGLSRERAMRRCTRKSARVFCSGFETDIELILMGRYIAIGFPEYDVGICTKDYDITQLKRMRDALPY